MSATEKVVNALNVSKLILCNSKMLTSEMCVKIGQVINDAIDLLKEQEAVEPIPYHRSDGTIFKYECRKCGTKIFKMDLFCRHCGKAVKWNDT